MSDTPRTDELIAELDANHEVAIPFVWRQMVNLARQLESALAAMTAQRDEAEAKLASGTLIPREGRFTHSWDATTDKACCEFEKLHNVEVVSIEHHAQMVDNFQNELLAAEARALASESERFTLDEIAAACMRVEISDSRYQGLAIELDASRARA